MVNEVIRSLVKGIRRQEATVVVEHDTETNRYRYRVPGFGFASPWRYYYEDVAGAAGNRKARELMKDNVQ